MRGPLVAQLTAGQLSQEIKPVVERLVGPAYAARIPYVRTAILMLALLGALSTTSLRPWLLSHCVESVACATDCCPTDPQPTAPAPDTCAFCVAVAVLPNDSVPDDLVAAPAPLTTAVVLDLVCSARIDIAVTPPVPPGSRSRHRVLQI